ncbi:hypothetical protein Tco_1248884, partial [Tanacetum coccineum]
VLLKVSPWKGVVRFRKKGKLAPRLVGPFEIIEKVGLVAYRLDFPEELNGVHDTFCNTPILINIAAEANLGYYFMDTTIIIIENDSKEIR